MKKITILCLSAFAFLHAQGQDNATTDTTKNNPISLNEVVISANKVDETKKTVAQQVQVLNANDIANSNAQSTADLLSNSGNVFVQKSQLGGGDINMRGFGANQNVLVIDGIRMNNLIYRAGHLQDIVKTDNNIFDRVEILFGPSSTVYGSDALGGAVLMYTKKPMLATGDRTSNVKVNVMSHYGSADNEMTEHLDFNYGTKKFGSLTSFTYAKFGDLLGGTNQNPFYTTSYGERPYYAKRFGDKDSLVKNEHRFLQVGTAYTQYDLMQKFLIKQSEHLSHSVNIQYSNSGDVPRYDRLTLPGALGLKSAEWYYGPQSRLLTAYDMNLKNADSKFQNIHFGLNYQALEESRHNRNFGDVWLKNRIENVGVIGANLDFQRTAKAHNIRFGADMQINNLKSTANKVNIVTDSVGLWATRFPDGVNKMNSFAMYLSDTWKLNDELTMVEGIRVGYSSLHCTLVDTITPPDPLPAALPYKEINQKSPVYSGNIGLIHSPSDNLKFSAMISTGFRVPNVDDVTKIFDPAPGTVIVPNVDLKPEKTINYELGMTNIFNKKTKLENYIYYTQFLDIIAPGNSTFNGKDSILYDGVMSQVVSNQNKGEAYIYGFSSNLVSQLSDNYRMSFMMNYTYGRIKTDTSDTPLHHVSPFMARLTFMYINKKFSSDFFINYNGWKRVANYCANAGAEDNIEYATPMGMPAWFTLNIHASYKVHKSITLQAGIDNMLDTQYRTFASGINASGRNVFVAVRGNF
jgi:hemoglobin/transferrin/lactoferrin receptor protein